MTYFSRDGKEPNDPIRTIPRVHIYFHHYCKVASYFFFFLFNLNINGNMELLTPGIKLWVLS